jgi:hypothetical protein
MDQQEPAHRDISIKVTPRSWPGGQIRSTVDLGPVASSRTVWQARRVIGVDLLSPASFAQGQPHDQFRWLRANDPVHWHPEPDGGGFWAVTCYRDVKAVGRDPLTFSSVPTVLTRLVDIRPTGLTEWLPSTFISGPKHLPISFRTAVPSPDAP